MLGMVPRPGSIEQDPVTHVDQSVWSSDSGAGSHREQLQVEAWASSLGPSLMGVRVRWSEEKEVWVLTPC